MQEQHKQLAREPYVDEGAVFTTPLGGRVTPMSATKALVRLAAAERLGKKLERSSADGNRDADRNEKRP